MIDINLDKRMELLYGLEYYVSRKNNIQFPWITENYKEYNDQFYKLCDKYITKEFETFVLQGNLGYYDQTVMLAFHLDKDYNITNRETITTNKNLDLLESLLKEFVKASNYDSFFDTNKKLFEPLKSKMSETINLYEEFNKEKIINFFGYEKGNMKIITLNFLRGNYGLLYNNDTYFISDIKRNNNEFFVSNRIIKTLYHEYSHPYINPLGEKYFKNLDLSFLLNEAKENGLEKWYNNSVILINEYVVRTCETILTSNIFDIQESLQINQNLGYTYINDLYNLFNNKKNYSTFEDFYSKEIVPFFINLNEMLKDNKNKII